MGKMFENVKRIAYVQATAILVFNKHCRRVHRPTC